MAETGSRLFCISDIHGCHDRLKTLMRLMPVDRDRDILVFLGDYIDRGPDSAKVLDLLLEIERTHHKVVFLKGNHEQMVLEYADTADADMVPALRMMGVEATVENYGGRIRSLQNLSCFPEEHKRLLRSLGFAWSWRNYVFTHADITEELIRLYRSGENDHIPDTVEEAQLVCGRRFLERKQGVDDTIVVFGHTPFLSPYVLPHQIGIDTGAVYGNALTGLELPAMRFYHA